MIKKYNKLVRDEIPEIIRKKGGIPKTHIATDIEYEKALKKKLKEEVNEFLEDPNEEELADILEVVRALGKSLGLTSAKLEKIRVQKAKKRGGFKKRIILEKVNKKFPRENPPREEKGSSGYDR